MDWTRAGMKLGRPDRHWLLQKSGWGQMMARTRVGATELKGMHLFASRINGTRGWSECSRRGRILSESGSWPGETCAEECETEAWPGNKETSCNVKFEVPLKHSRKHLDVLGMDLNGDRHWTCQFRNYQNICMSWAWSSHLISKHSWPLHTLNLVLH